MAPDPAAAHRLADLTWPQVAELRDVAPVALVPLGACEQHGLGMALRTDTTRAEFVADRVAERLAPRIVVTPAIPVGVSEHHMAMPGTLTLTGTTLQLVVRELVTSLYRHGWRKVFVLTGHGGNNSAVDVAVSALRAEFQDLHLAWSGITPLVPDVAADLATSKVRGHSCEIETSQALYVDPTLVQPDRLARGSADQGDLDEAGRLSRSHPGIRFPQSYASLSPTGALGDATTADVEAGERLVETAVDRLCAFLEGLAALPPRQPDHAAYRTPPPPPHPATQE